MKNDGKPRRTRFARANTTPRNGKVRSTVGIALIPVVEAARPFARDLAKIKQGEKSKARRAARRR